MFNLTNYMNEHSSEWIYNTTPVQRPLSITCGHFCVYYLLCICRGISMKNILSHFNTNIVKNDQKIVIFIKDNFNIEGG